MGYGSAQELLTGVLLKAKSCPFLAANIHCAGGDYCPFPEGQDKICCFFCSKLAACPDKTGICVRLKEVES